MESIKPRELYAPDAAATVGDHDQSNDARRGEGASAQQGQNAKRYRWAPWVKYISIVIIIIGILFIMRQLPTHQWIDALSKWVKTYGVWGGLIYGGIYIIGAICFIPGAAMTLAAGAIFGLLWGTVIVSIASTVAAALAFLIARYVARSTVQGWAKNSDNFAAIDSAIGEQGWKIVGLLRLSPVIPYSLSNYLFGITSVGFWSYVLTSWIAMLPGTFLYVYLGYAGRAAAGGKHSVWEWVGLGVGLVATVVVTIYITHVARKAIKEQTDVKHDQDQNQEHNNDSHGDEKAAAGQEQKHGGKPWGAVIAAVVAVVVIVLAACSPQLSKLVSSGPPAVTLHEAYQPKPNGPTFDNSLFDKVVKRVVNNRGLVNFAGTDGLLVNHKMLDEYLQQVANAPFDQLGRNQKLALLINAYNAYTLKLILNNWRVTSIMDISKDQRWDKKFCRIGTHTWSLNEIEHQQLRPKFNEPRMHFALVCAALGCPPLRNEAYDPARVSQQFQSQAEYCMSHPRWFQYDRKDNKLYLTSIMKWYGGDFEQADGSAVKFAAKYSSQFKQALDAGQKPDVVYMPYNWTLYSQANKDKLDKYVKKLQDMVAGGGQMKKSGDKSGGGKSGG